MNLKEFLELVLVSSAGGVVGSLLALEALKIHDRRKGRG